MHKLFSVILICFLIASCSKEAFMVESESLKRSVDVTVDNTGEYISYSEVLDLRADFSIEELKYSFLTKDPSGDLSWEGVISSSSSVALGLTDGATFPSGEYTIIYYADNGTELKSAITLPKRPEGLPYFNSEGVLTCQNTIAVIEYGKEGREIKREASAKEGYKLDDSTAMVTLSYVDRYLNQITIEQAIEVI